MKFLVVFAVLSVCAINSNAFFLKGHKLFGGKSGSSSGASSESYAAPPPPPPPPAEPAAPAGNPLAGLGQLLA